MIIENSFKQGDTAWHEARLNSIGGTGISNIITSTGQPSKSRGKFLYEKASQRITGKAKPIFTTYEMQWGLDHEADARDLFSLIKGFEVEECAMMWADEKKENHISPDGFNLERKEGLEIKCPQLQTHVGYLDKGVLPIAYRLQVQSSLALTGWECWQFMSYFPEIEPLIIPIHRDEKLITVIKNETERFLEDVNNLVTKLKS